jgi:predicted DNA-binding transcriptional regulator AlpA
MATWSRHMEEQFIPAKKVSELTSLSRASIDRLSEAGAFVKPIYITGRRKVYPRSAVVAWMKAKMEGELA